MEKRPYAVDCTDGGITGRRPTPRLTFHARLRTREMGLGTKSVKAVVALPEIDTPTYRGLRILVGGALAVVYDPAANEVVTVLWALGDDRGGGPIRKRAA